MANGRNLAYLVVALTAFAAVGQTATTTDGDVITSDTYFYGDSPPVYPSPQGRGLGDWSSAYHMATSLVSKMTLEEKVGLVSGSPSNTGCVGAIGPIDRLGFPGMCLQDAENGVRAMEFVSAWPAGIHVGASWNKDLALARGKGMGGEFKAKGINVLLGPVVGPLGRTVKAGRLWEGFGADPYLAGAMVGETIQGVQSSGVATSTKHFIGNEQETSRKPVGDLASVSANIDDKAMHELYLWPFQDAVRAGTASVMCSYQRINNSYACQNSKTMNGLLKDELGFQGFVVTDWQAIHGGVASTLSGLDLAQPNDGGFWGGNLTQAVNNGTVPGSRVTDMVTRIIASWYRLNQNKEITNPGFGMPQDMSAPHTPVDARNPAFKKTLYQGAVEGHVLLKNDGVLPLKKPKMLSVFGFSARSSDQNSVNGDWGLGYSPYNYSGITYETTGPVPPSVYQPIAINGTLYSGGGSGSSSPSLVYSPMEAITAQAWEDDTVMFWDFTTDNPSINAASDACIVVTNLYGSEDFDRPAIESDYSNNLIANVAKTCNNTIVVVHNAGPGLVNPSWYNLPNVKAVIFAHLPGQYSGKALVDLLYGRENFSGKLPYTVAKNESDYGSLLNPDLPEGEFALFPQSNFSEGVYIDYRRFDTMDIKPQFEFGYGLSYTKFEYSGLKIQTRHRGNSSAYPTGPITSGGQQDLWDTMITAHATVKNTGSVDGAEVAQLYIKMPGLGQKGNAVKQLRGFDKKTIRAGQSTSYKFELTRRDLSVWDVTAQKWKMQSGTYGVMVGGSSQDLPLQQNFSL